MARSLGGLGPFAVDDMLQLVNHHIQQFHVLSPLTLGSILNLKSILMGIMRSISAWFTDATGRLWAPLRVHAAISPQSQKNFFQYTPLHTMKEEAEARPPVHTVVS